MSNLNTTSTETLAVEYVRAAGGVGPAGRKLNTPDAVRIVEAIAKAIGMSKTALMDRIGERQLQLAAQSRQADAAQMSLLS